MIESPDFDSPEYAAHLYDIYRRIREEDPVHCVQVLQARGYALFLYEDVADAARDQRFGSVGISDELVTALILSGCQDLASLARSTGLLHTLDPPDHTRMRSLVEKPFRSRVGQDMRERIVTFVNELLDAAEPTGSMDLISDFAVSLPVAVICELLGFPSADREQLKRWSDDLAPLLDTSQMMKKLKRGARAVIEFQAYLAPIVARRRDAPQDDLISDLAKARYGSAKLSDGELLSTCLFLLAAGHETTSSLIGNGMLALLQHPDQMERLRSEPNLISSAVEEMLRYDGPLQFTGRVTREDVELRGTVMPKGTRVRLVLGSANRDPRRFPNPDRFDIGREDNGHISFGGGIHTCFGAHLARLESQIAISMLLERFPNMTLTTDRLEWHPGGTFRSLRSLQVTF